MPGLRTFPFLWVRSAGTRGIFILEEDGWSVLESDEPPCGSTLFELGDRVLLTAAEAEHPGCAWDLRTGALVAHFDAPRFDVYVRGEGMTLAWGRLHRAEPGPTNPSPPQLHSNDAALIELAKVR